MIVLSTIINCYLPIYELINPSNNYTNSYTTNSIAEEMSKSTNPELYQEIIDMASNIGNIGIQMVSLDQANICMYALMILVPMIMIFVQFKFLNSRKACDFFHSIPVTRLSLVVNFSLSAITWTTLCMIIPILTNVFICNLNNSISLYYDSLFLSIVEKVIIALLVYSAMLVGISLSGQFITSVVVACLILFLPRYIVTMAVQSINSNTDLFKLGNILYTSVIDNYNNLLVSMFTSIPDSLSSYKYKIYPTDYYNPIQPYIYTTILAMVIFALGCYTFVKRKSESAGHNTPNTLVQHIIRVGLVSPIMILVVYVYNSSSYYIESFSDHLEYIFPALIVTIVIYFTFELITTKSLKKLINSIPVFGIVILFAIAYNGVIYAGTNLTLTQAQNNTKNIDSVSLNLSANATPLYDSYTFELISEYKLTDERILSATTNAINTYIDVINNNTNLNFSGNGYVKANNISQHIKFTKDDLLPIITALREDEYINTTLLSQIPAKADVSTIRVTTLNSNYDNEKTQRVLDVFYDEFATLTEDQKLTLMYNPNYTVVELDYDSVENNNWLEGNNDIVNATSLISNMSSYYYSYSQNYKENILYEYDANANNEYKTSPVPYSSYNSNDLPIVMGLVTNNGAYKYITLNTLLPNTKKELIDIFIESNQYNYKLFEYVINNTVNTNNDMHIQDINFKSLRIVSLDDYYNFSDNWINKLGGSDIGYSNPNLTCVPSQELIDLFNTAHARILDSPENIDYDNMYVVSLATSLVTRNNHYYNNMTVLLPFTQEEYETILINLTDYAKFMVAVNGEPELVLPQQ